MLKNYYVILQSTCYGGCLWTHGTAFSFNKAADSLALTVSLAFLTDGDRDSTRFRRLLRDRERGMPPETGSGTATQK